MAQIIKGPSPLTIEKDDAEIEVGVDILNFEGANVIATPDGDCKVTISFGDDDDNKMIGVRCIDNGDCDPIVEAAILVDSTVCFIRNEEC